MVRTVHLAGVIDAIDYTNRYVAVRGPKGNTVSLKVAENVPLDQLSAGDRISVTHTEALAIEMAAQARRRKSPPSK